MKILLSEIIFLIIHHLFFPVCSVSVLIDSQNGHDDSSHDCMLFGFWPCRTLEFVSSHLSSFTNSNVTITMVSSELPLQGLAKFDNVSNFTLQGLGKSKTTIICNIATANANKGAGIQFVNSFGINLRNFSIKNCGAMLENYSVSDNNSQAILMIDSKNITIVDIIVANSRGYGLSLININDTLLLEKSSFEENASFDCYNGSSGGLLIAVISSNIQNSNYEITNCTFLKNKANPNVSRWNYTTNHGGGMVILLLCESIANTITVKKCLFKQNQAHFGAGLYIKCESKCINNTITFIEGNFTSNIATTGGGGMDIGYSLARPITRKSYISVPKRYTGIPTHNVMHFIHCNITNNTGKFGGGVAIFTDTVLRFPSDRDRNQIKFESCLFLRNMANGGAAVDINIGYRKDSFFFITLNHFVKCNFTDNTAGRSTNMSSKITQSGAFFTSKVYAYFEGETRFEDNIGTALYVSSTNICFTNATIIFKNNKGGISGGILLIGESYLQLIGKNYFTFQNNAGSFGGALCAVILETHYFQYTDNCFIKDSAYLYPHNNILEFVNNTATTGIAHDLFVSNLLPCISRYPSKDCNNVSKLLTNPCFASFKFYNKSNSSYATATAKITGANKTLTPIPGIPFNLGISQIDQFNNSVEKLFPLSAVIEKSEVVTIDDDYAFVTENTVIVKGSPNDHAVLTLQSNIIVVVMVSVPIIMSECPPGFFFNKTKLVCSCKQSKFITQCPDRKGVASLKQGHWAGYMNVNNTKKKVFAIGTCEYRLCVYGNHSLPKYGSYDLPSKYNPKGLQQFICGKYRQGTLCGRCIAGYTVYYNSPSFKCDKITHVCYYGIIFYILAEIIPVTLIFLVIIIFNIHLTSGSLYSFIFYGQTLSILYVNAYGSIRFKGFAKTFFDGYKIFYGILNLKFAVAEKLSFCLTRKAMTTMDIFIIQYITVIYSLFLIFITILILKVNSLYACIKLCHKCGRRNIRGSVINGLTAFIVLCYFKCVEVTCSILIPIDINFLSSDELKPIKVPLFDGDMEYLKGDHLKYAIPAIICLFVIILPPPMLLLFESVAMKLNKSFRIRRNCLTYFLHRIRMKTLPFLDSFQGCFKDNRRCFAGLFFIYKVLLLTPYMYIGNISYDFMSSLIVLFGITVLHVYYHPFQKPWQNTLDAVLLINLLLVNILTLNHYNALLLANESNLLNDLYMYLQMFCIMLPSIYLVVLLVRKIVIKFNLVSLILKAARKKSTESVVSRTIISTFDTEVIESDSLPFRLYQDNKSYNSFHINSYEDANS